jgi:hypothetical protein
MFRAALERGERIGAGPVLKAWRGLLVFMSRWFQIESLYKFNAKFSPIWEPRFFVYPGGRDVPRMALAALEAEAFLVWPRLGVKRYVRRVGRRLGFGRVRRSTRAVVPRRDDPPYPPMPAQPGLIAKTATVSGPTAQTKCAEGDDPPYPSMPAQPGLIAKTATVSGPTAQTKCAEGDHPPDPQKSQSDPVPGRKGTAS